MGPYKLLNSLAVLATVALVAVTLPAQTAFSASAPNINKLIIKRNYKAAIAALAKQASAGDAAAQFRLGTFYRLGLGTKRDDAAALEWISKSADAGNAQARNLLKRMASTPPATPKKPAAPVNTKQSDDGKSVDLGKLPARLERQPDWLTFAAARNRDGVVKTMLANLNGANSGDSKAAAVQTAARTSSVEALVMLVAAGSELNRSDVRKMTPLMLAVETGNVGAVGAVLLGKPDLLQKNQSGNTAIALAARNCQPDIIHMLLESGADFSTDGSEEPPLVSTVKFCADWLPFARFLPATDTNSTDGHGRSAVWYAAANGNLPALERFAEAGANLETQDKDGFTPLHAAAANGHDGAVGYIISRGSAVSPLSRNGTTPLMLAANAGCATCLPKLMAKTADINEKNSVGDTALMFAVRGGHANIAKLLLGGGANANARNTNDDTPLKLANRMKLQGLELLK